MFINFMMIMEAKAKLCWDSVMKLIRWVQQHSLHSLWTLCVRRTKHVVFGKRPQAPQPIISIGLRKVLWQCSVHLLPICGTITLSYFNLAGYYIGNGYTGLTQTIYQDLDALMIQIAAKLMVILLTTSGFVCINIDRKSLWLLQLQ